MKNERDLQGRRSEKGAGSHSKTRETENQSTGARGPKSGYDQKGSSMTSGRNAETRGSGKHDTNKYGNSR